MKLYICYDDDRIELIRKSLVSYGIEPVIVDHRSSNYLKDCSEEMMDGIENSDAFFLVYTCASNSMLLNIQINYAWKKKKKIYIAKLDNFELPSSLKFFEPVADIVQDYKVEKAIGKLFGGR